MTTQNLNAVNPSFNQTFVSPDTFFIPHPNANGDSAYDAVTSLLSMAEATLVSLSSDGSDLKEGFTMSHPIIVNLLWSIQTQVTMAQAALQHMSQADQAAKKNGGAK